MARRELRATSSGAVVGSVRDSPPTFERAAGVVFKELRAELGDAEAARYLINSGWSNGYLYLE